MTRGYNGYRCWTCGTLRRAREVVPGEGQRGIACREHPDAPAIMWNREHEYALVYIDQIAGGAPFKWTGDPNVAPTLEDFAQMYDEDEWPGVSRSVMAVVVVLFRRWGKHPERALPEPVRERAASPIGLYS